MTNLEVFDEMAREEQQFLQDAKDMGEQIRIVADESAGLLTASALQEAILGFREHTEEEKQKLKIFKEALASRVSNHELQWEYPKDDDTDRGLKIIKGPNFDTPEIDTMWP